MKMIFTAFFFSLPLFLLGENGGNFSSMQKEDRALLRDLILLNYPPADWRKEREIPGTAESFDVAIVGGGMAGLTAGAALFKEGIFNIKLFDQNAQGEEGPWRTYARMNTLRTEKSISGPALGVPHLTFHAWYEAVFGAQSWNEMEKIPNGLWMDYLNWFRQAMRIPVENECKLVDLTPLEEGLGFELEFQKRGNPFFVKARKVVLATGRAGFGGPDIPNFAAFLPKSRFAHTMDLIDFDMLKNKHVGIVGVGASSFDAAASALEKGAKSVHLLMRRKNLPNVNKFGCLPFKGFSNGYCKLSDQKRWQFMREALDAGVPPPRESLNRLKNYTNFRIFSNTAIAGSRYDGEQIVLETNRGPLRFDFLIFGTGFEIDGFQQAELAKIIDQIALWKDRLPTAAVAQAPKMGRFPYLGPSYEFLPKKNGSAPYLKDIYCFNFAATLSLGILSGDIPGISIGATRLAEGIAADFFVQECDWYLDRLENYQVKEFEEEYIQLLIE